MKIFIHQHTNNNFQVKWSCPRTELIISEGFSKIPSVKLVDNEYDADYVIWHHVPQNHGQKSFELINKINPKKLVVIDSIDENNEYFLPELNPDRYFLYFKRSMVRVHDKYNKTVLPFEERQYPWDYAVLDGFYQPEQEKNIDIGCYLRPSCYFRTQVLKSMDYWQNVVKNFKTIVGPVSEGSRSNDDGEVIYDNVYFDYLAKTKIIVSSGPYGWCGDSRGCEATANKCCYLSNEFLDLMPNSPQDGVHYFKFHPEGSFELYGKLKYLLENPEKTKRIAEQGYLHCRDYHSSESRCRYILEKIEENSCGY